MAVTYRRITECLVSALVVGAVIAPTLAGAAPKSRPMPKCFGKTATIFVPGTEYHEVDGTPGSDVIVTFGGRDVIDGMGGKDVICSGGDKDIIHGGAGSDRIHTGAGDDYLYAGIGSGTISGGSGADHIYGGPSPILK